MIYYHLVLLTRTTQERSPQSSWETRPQPVPFAHITACPTNSYFREYKCWYTLHRRAGEKSFVCRTLNRRRITTERTLQGNKSGLDFVSRSCGMVGSPIIVEELIRSKDNINTFYHSLAFNLSLMKDFCFYATRRFSWHAHMVHRSIDITGRHSLRMQYNNFQYLVLLVS